MKTKISRWLSLLLLLLPAGCTTILDTSDADVIIISVDTLRADHLGIYGYKQIRTPNIDRLGKNGVVFEHARVSTPLTLPSHTSILTGLYPPSHGVRDNGKYKASENLTTLAEIFKNKGYNTGAVVGSFVLDRRFGLDQGFDHYDDSGFNKKAGGEEIFFIAERTAKEVTDRALEWVQSLYGVDSKTVAVKGLSGNENKNFFLLVHYFDPHGLYSPPQPYASIYKGKPYDGEIAYTDEQIGLLLDGIAEIRGNKQRVVVLTSDHGESLGEHGEMTHGTYIYDSTVHVPLIISAPDKIKARRIEWRVRSIDIAPTLLELVGTKYDGKMDGSSLVTLIKGKGKDRETYLESSYARLH
tara:strand:+ start:413 stop:1477 length:1065 start_codon:yes stop_codon:yes gene_type:complete